MEKNLGQINQELRSFAISHGLCSKWQKEWENDWSFDTLAQRYLMGIDFCFKHEYPSNEYLLSNFEQSFRRSVGIIVDDNYSLLNPEVCAIMGNSKAKVRTNSNTVSSIWIKDNAEVILIARGRSSQHVHVFGNAKINVEDCETNAEVLIFRHSDKVEVTPYEKPVGNVIIHEELDYLKK